MQKYPNAREFMNAVEQVRVRVRVRVGVGVGVGVGARVRVRVRLIRPGQLGPRLGLGLGLGLVGLRITESNAPHLSDQFS